MKIIAFLLLLFIFIVSIHASETVPSQNWVVRIKSPLGVSSAQVLLGLDIVSSETFASGCSIMCVHGTSPNQVVETQASIVNRLEAAGISDFYVDTEKRVEAEEYWHLDRVDQRSLPLDNAPYSPVSGLTGAGVNIYIVDTGVEISHSDFGGRASNSFTTFGSFADGHGHGTHVAGIAAGGTFGVAQQALIKNVRVLDSSGSGSTFTVALGLQHVLDTGIRPGVINLSLGYFGTDIIINSIIGDLISAGFVVVAAAGNSAGESCDHEPSSVTGVISVAASDINDVSANFNNVGTCVTMFAPGVSITSSFPGDTETVMSGTSMAAPHVSGAAALVLQQSPALSVVQVISQLLQWVTVNVLSLVVGSPNRLLHVGTNGVPSPSQAPSASSPPSNSAEPSSSGQLVVGFYVVCSIVLTILLQ